jgi:beta-glucosidase
LGLFENPYPRADRFNRIGTVENKAIALEAARQSLVLLQNDGVLPLLAPKNILVVGPTTNSKRNICGAWTIEWGGAAEELFPKDMETVFSAITNEFDGAVVDSMVNPLRNRTEFETKAQHADVIVIAVGEEPHAEGRGNLEDLTLDNSQLEIIKAVQATGKKNIITIFSGRPRIISSVAAKSNAILWAGLPGYEGAKALAEVIGGRTNPSGKLSFTYPRAGGHITPYNVKVHDTYTYAWPFGHGLSYTQFEYSNLILSDSIIKPVQQITAKVTIKNKGTIDGYETALWYVSDVVRTTTPAIKELKHFEKIYLKAGDQKEFTFTITPNESLSYPNEKGVMQLEDGTFVITINQLKKNLYLTQTGTVDFKKREGKSHLQEDI